MSVPLTIVIWILAASIFMLRKRPPLPDGSRQERANCP